MSDRDIIIKTLWIGLVDIMMIMKMIIVSLHTMLTCFFARTEWNYIFSNNRTCFFVRWNLDRKSCSPWTPSRFCGHSVGFWYQLRRGIRLSKPWILPSSEARGTRDPRNTALGNSKLPYRFDNNCKNILYC